MEQLPKLLKLTRQTIAVLNTLKKLLDALATAGTGASLVAAIGAAANAQDKPVFLLFTTSLSTFSLLARTGLSYVSSVSVISNPLDETTLSPSGVDPPVTDS
jgi:hypothetical protein